MSRGRRGKGVYMKRIGVLFGGRSGEHEVSLLSARTVIDALKQEKEYEVVPIGITRDGSWYIYSGDSKRIADGSWERDAARLLPSQMKERIDFAFPVIHGSYGEDGTLQGLLEMLDIPYAGSGVMSSAICMDKAAAKDVFVHSGIPTCPYVLVLAEDAERDPGGVAAQIAGTFPGPVFVKPANMGSSIGISKAIGRREIQAAIEKAIRYNRRVIVEKAIVGREFEVALLGNGEPEATVPGEIVTGTEYYDYEAKYSGSGTARVEIPAELPLETAEKLQGLARAAFRAADCAGYARADFFVEEHTGRVYINEINTIPGFTAYSMFPMLWRHEGVEPGELLRRIIRLGEERYHDKNNRQTVCR